MKRAHASAYLNEMAMAMELLGEPPAQIAAHRETAMKIETIPPGEWDEWLVEFALRDKASELEERLSRIPPGLYLLLKLPGLTPALVRRLWIEGQIISIKRLERACHREALIKIDGFDRKTQTRLQLEIKRLRRRRSLWLRRTALEVAAEREEQLAGTRGIIRFAQSGELRRNLEVVSEISWVIAADPPQRVLGRLGTLAGAILPTPQTPDTICFAISDRIRERMVVVNESEYIARIFFETGVPAHTRDILMRLSERDDPATPPITKSTNGRRCNISLPSCVKIEAKSRRRPPGSYPNWLLRRISEVCFMCIQPGATGRDRSIKWRNGPLKWVGHMSVSLIIPKLLFMLTASPPSRSADNMMRSPSRRTRARM